MKILITSGGTTIPIDMVRKITNMSKGTFGSNICKSFINQLADITTNINNEIVFLTSVNGKLPVPYNNIRPVPCDNFECTDQNIKVNVIYYDTFDQYKEMLFKLLQNQQFDIIMLAAAVSDYGVANYMEGKVRSTDDQMTIQLVKLPKLISSVRDYQPNSTIVGFKLLVNSTQEQLLIECEKSIKNNHIDMVIGNDLRDIKQDNHTLLIGTNIIDTIYYDSQSKNNLIIQNMTLAEYVVKKVLYLNELKQLLNNKLMEFDKQWVDCIHRYFKYNNKFTSNGISYCTGPNKSCDQVLYDNDLSVHNITCEDQNCFKLQNIRHRIKFIMNKLATNIGINITNEQ